MLYNSDIKTVSVNIEKRFPRSGCLEAWNRIKKFVEEAQNTSTNSARDAITPLVERAVTTDGCHHKQWYLEAIAEALQIDLPPHDLGIAP